MTSAVKGQLRRWRYAMPEALGQAMPAPPLASVARASGALGRRGITTSVGYFARDDEPAGMVAARLCELAQLLRAEGSDTILALKPPQLGFDPALVRRIASHGLPLVLDALAHAQADAIHALAQETGSGLALPARWLRSRADAERLRDTPRRIRLMKGEWADPAGDPADIAAAYLDLAGMLAGRKAPVGVATHDPALAARALVLLRDAGTPVELEQLRGLPRRRTMRVASELAVPVRLYTACGPGWWPYAIEQALRRPYLPWWALRDWLGLEG